MMNPQGGPAPFYAGPQGFSQGQGFNQAPGYNLGPAAAPQRLVMGGGDAPAFQQPGMPTQPGANYNGGPSSRIPTPTGAAWSGTKFWASQSRNVARPPAPKPTAASPEPWAHPSCSGKSFCPVSNISSRTRVFWFGEHNHPGFRGGLGQCSKPDQGLGGSIV